MLKVHILTQCLHCKGQGYLPAGEAENIKGEMYTRYLPRPRLLKNTRFLVTFQQLEV